MNTIYISGPITDNQTGLPKKYWQEDFIKTEDKLVKMGYNVITPVELAKEIEGLRAGFFELYKNGSKMFPKTQRTPTRADYIMYCLEAMMQNYRRDNLHGVYLIGQKQPIYYSHGVQMELHMAKALEIPVFYELYDGNEIDIHLLPIKDGLQMADNGKFVKETWSQHFMDDRGHFQSEDEE